jgi:hypothetical protein
MYNRGRGAASRPLNHRYRRTKTMVIDFTSDEEFHQWCQDHHDDGFFVGYAPGYPPKIPGASTNIPRMHRASCKVATTRARSNYVGRLYEKSDSTDRRALVLHFEPAGLQYCRHCDPRDDGS